ncbi:unnamed protein product [Coccothraustes coccothraustes]
MRRKHMCVYSTYVIAHSRCSLTLFSGPQREPAALGKAIPAGAGSSWIHPPPSDPSVLGAYDLLQGRIKSDSEMIPELLELRRQGTYPLLKT